MSRRARTVAAVQNHIPSEDALRFVPPGHYLPALSSALEAYSFQAAPDGLEFVTALCNKSDLPRPAARWKQSAHPPHEPTPQLSDRAAGVLGEIVTATGHVDAARRAAVFRRSVMSFRLQQ